MMEIVIVTLVTASLLITVIAVHVAHQVKIDSKSWQAVAEARSKMMDTMTENLKNANNKITDLTEALESACAERDECQSLLRSLNEVMNKH